MGAKYEYSCSFFPGTLTELFRLVAVIFLIQRRDDRRGVVAYVQYARMYKFLGRPVDVCTRTLGSWNVIKRHLRFGGQLKAEGSTWNLISFPFNCNNTISVSEYP